MRRPSDIWPDDAELSGPVREAQRGTPGALDALLGFVRPVLLMFFTRWLAPDDAEDVTQDSLLRVARALQRIDARRASRFLTRIAWNRLRSALLRQERDLARFAPLELAEAIESPLTADADLEYEDFVRTLRRASAATLAPELQDVVQGLLCDLSPAEIAARQHVHPVTIRTRLLRVRASLRRHLQLGGNGASSATGPTLGSPSRRPPGRSPDAPRVHSPLVRGQNAFPNSEVGEIEGAAQVARQASTPIGAPSGGRA